MTPLFAGVRKGDAVLAALLTAFGVFIMIESINAGADADLRIDSHSWLTIPVFAAATLPILWRRRNLVAVYAVTAAALAVHVVAFGWMVRCGAGLPLAFALAYAAGRLDSGRRSVALLVATVAIQVLVLIEDSAAGLGILPVTAVLGIAAWGIGTWVRRRSTTGSAAAPVPAGSYA